MGSSGKSPLYLVLGAANVGDKSLDSIARFDTPTEVQAYLDAFARRGYYKIDTARIYSPHAPGSSEPRIGAVAALDRFLLDSKVKSGQPGCHTKGRVLEEIEISLKTLNVKQLNIEYLHIPDRETPFEEACEAMDQAYKEGKFKRWGISNYTADEVQRFIDICDERGLVKPSVYQGQYNPIVRGGEKALFPILRKHNIAFYAFSPAAGGFFAGNHKTVKAGGRYDASHFVGGMYSQLYLKSAILDATNKALEVASSFGIGGHDAALRWTAYHSALSKEYGDSIIIGSSTIAQLDANIDMIETGPLPAEVVDAFEALHEEVGDQVPYHQ